MGPRRARTVLHLVDDLEIGGAQRLVVQFSNDRVARGDAVVVCARDGGPLWADLDAAVERLPWTARSRTIDTAMLVGRLRRIARTRGVRIVHVHGRALAVAARIAVRGLPAVVIEHVHNTFRPSTTGRLLSFRGRYLVACGSAVEEMLINGFRRPASSVRLIRNGVRDGGAPKPLPPFGSSPRLRLVAVGALNEQKDPGRFVRIMRELHRAGRLEQAVWVGPGDTAGWNEAAAASGVGDVLRFVGPVNDPRAHLDSAHLLMMSSRHEGLPLVALEALSAGRGVVLPDVGSCRDVFAVDPDAGLLYAPGEDDATLARQLAAEAVQGSPERWGRSARSAYETGFTLNTLMTAIDQLYAEVAGT